MTTAHPATTSDQDSSPNPWGTALPEPRPDLIAPGSALHRALCDATVGVYALPLFVLPLLHPATAAATFERDTTFAGDQLELKRFLIRIRDTIDLIGGIVYAGPEAADCAHGVRELHRDMKGELPSGEAYHPWTRDIWTYNWAAISAAILAVYGTFRGWPDRAFEQDCYRGLVEVGRQFGVRGLPEQLTDFESQWPAFRDAIAAPETAAIGTVIDALNGPGLATPPIIRALPDVVWRAMTAPVRHAWRQSLQATLPDDVLTELGLQPSEADLRWLRRQQQGWRLIPRGVTYRLGRGYFWLRTKQNPVWRTRYSRASLTRL